MSFKKNYFYFVFIVMGLFACSREYKEDVPDVSDIDISVKLKRFDKDLFALDTNNIAPGLAALEEKYPEFSAVYFEKILESKNPKVAPDGHEAYVKGFLEFPTVRHLFDTCLVVYNDMSAQERSFEQAFRFLKYYFPDLATPDVTIFVSEYSYAAFIFGDNSLAVGLDFFLGADYPYFQYNQGNPSFSNYLTRSFTKEHMVTKALRPLVEDLCGEAPADNRLIDLMVHNGKKLYIMDHLFPYTADSIKLEMTQEQVDWMKNNEYDMWTFFLSEDLLYSTDWSKIKKYVTPSPNSPGMPDVAPGRTANWLGWQIVKKYMRLNPQTTMYELIEMRDAQAMLERSKYKPKR
ncbi:MAG: hypothetical protein KDC85_01170 [Saprospiraceae bacterium]|nr:hypothetical protein [Saprospiraceae bacterium]MCB9326840.1 hypothetical protein [Lewinellaceae bacterium]